MCKPKLPCFVPKASSSIFLHVFFISKFARWAFVANWPFFMETKNKSKPSLVSISVMPQEAHSDPQRQRAFPMLNLKSSKFSRETSTLLCMIMNNCLSKTHLGSNLGVGVSLALMRDSPAKTCLSKHGSFSSFLKSAFTAKAFVYTPCPAASKCVCVRRSVWTDVDKRSSFVFGVTDPAC